MSPTTREIVANRPLSGTELKSVILADVADILAADGLLAGQVAFGRVSYDVTVKLHLDNHSYPEHDIRLKSRPRPEDVLAQSPELRPIAAAPLAEPSADSVVRGATRARTISSPNKLRVEQGLPLTVTTRNSEGNIEDRQVVYKPEEAGLDESQVNEDVVDREMSEQETTQEWGPVVRMTAPIDVNELLREPELPTRDLSGAVDTFLENHPELVAPDQSATPAAEAAALAEQLAAARAGQDATNESAIMAKDEDNVGQH